MSDARCAAIIFHTLFAVIIVGYNIFCIVRYWLDLRSGRLAELLEDVGDERNSPKIVRDVGMKSSGVNAAILSSPFVAAIALILIDVKADVVSVTWVITAIAAVIAAPRVNNHFDKILGIEGYSQQRSYLPPY